MIRLFFITSFLLISLYSEAQTIQWASTLIDFSSEYKEDIPNNSTRYSATQVLGYPNTVFYKESILAWAPAKSQAGKEFVVVGYDKPQLVTQIIVGESLNAGAIEKIILYDDRGKEYTAYENKHPSATQKYDDILTYLKIKPVYNINKLKLILNTNAVAGMQQIDCIGISSTLEPYKPIINTIQYTEPIGLPENLGAAVNSEYYDHLPIVSPDGNTLYFARKFAEDNKGKKHKDDIYFSKKQLNGKWGKAVNIGDPLNTEMNNYVFFVSADNERLYLANNYKNDGGGVSVSTRKNDGSWGKPKALNIANYYNKNEFSCYHLNMNENVLLMCLQRDGGFGDLDIYASFKYADGNWSEPTNLGAKINTVGAEASVFLAADGKTIYFSSTGRQGYGSYDMYMAKRLDNSWKNWSEPLNLGTAINTPKMDIYYTIPLQGDYIYYSTENSYFGQNDLYRIKLPKEVQPEIVDLNAVLANAPLKKETQDNTLDNKIEQLKQQQQKNQPVENHSTNNNAISQNSNQNNTPVNNLQQKIDALKLQQQQAKNNPTIISSPKENTNNSIPVNATILPTADPKTIALQQKLERLKQQQQETPQSTKIIENPTLIKPNEPLPLKEKQEDKGAQVFTDYQQKIEQLKKQQQTPTITNTTTVQTKETLPLDKQNSEKLPTQPNAIVDKDTNNIKNPTIIAYEEKLKKMKEEMAVLTIPSPAISDSKKEEIINNNKPTENAIETPIRLTKTEDNKNEIIPIPLEQHDSSQTIKPEKNETGLNTKTIAFEEEKKALDSIQKAQKDASEKLNEVLDKLGSNKQDLEKDIASLEQQRTQFSSEKDKLTAQNTQLSSEKTKLEEQKKQMDDLLAQMQAERDKLAAEKQKMEQDKAKLDALKRQQERDVLTLKRSIDSLGKIQQQASLNTAAQQKYDLFNVPIEVGAVAIAEKILFVADATFLQIPSYPELDKVVAFLKKNDKLIIEIGGHTNGLCDDVFCTKLSLGRAKTCVDYLISKGIKKERLSYKGYGKQFLIADPGSPLNQRVEIKILSVK